MNGKGWSWWKRLLGKFGWYRKGLRYQKERRTIQWKPWQRRGAG